MPADRPWTDKDRELVAGALAARIRYSQHGQRCPVWTRAKGVEIGEQRAPTVAELVGCDCWIMAGARRDGAAVLDALTDAGKLPPEPTETRTEWGVWWHTGDPAGIVLDTGKLVSEWQARREGQRRIGEYGTDSFTVIRREHRFYPDGVWSGNWQRHSGPHTKEETDAG